MKADKKRRAEAAKLELLSRNARPSRQSKTLGGKPLCPPLERPLQELREDVGVTQSQLAESVGLPASAIASVENKRYALSARNGIDIYMALARFAAPQSPQYREAKQEAANLIAFQKELCRKALIAAQGQIESLKKKIEETKAIEADVDSKEARLREI